MSTELESFDIGELAAAGGVTTRTVRYYVQQGLLPSSDTRGPGARYDRGHLERLLLIKRLQSQHLPLAEIRRRIESLNADDVHLELARAPSGPAFGGSSAKDYVREVLFARREQSVPIPAPPPMPRSGAVQAPPPPTSHPVSTKLATRSTWERVALAPDVELHLRRPLSREHNRLVERLLEAARQLFTEES
ncbi:MAG: MerR family transcriptional regulator [Gemmatimonadota bacterium]|nr:MerR family transcriptional regulator [Gemmatimonadota bacterium]